MKTFSFQIVICEGLRLTEISFLFQCKRRRETREKYEKEEEEEWKKGVVIRMNMLNGNVLLTECKMQDEERTKEFIMKEKYRKEWKERRKPGYKLKVRKSEVSCLWISVREGEINSKLDWKRKEEVKNLKM